MIACCFLYLWPCKSKTNSPKPHQRARGMQAPTLRQSPSSAGCPWGALLAHLTGVLWSLSPTGRQVPWRGLSRPHSRLLARLALSTGLRPRSALSFTSFGCKVRISASLRLDVSICKREKIMSTSGERHTQETDRGRGSWEPRWESLTHLARALRASPGVLDQRTGLGPGEPQQSWHLLPAEPLGILQRQRYFFSESRLFKIMILFLLFRKVKQRKASTCLVLLMPLPTDPGVASSAIWGALELAG